VLQQEGQSPKAGRRWFWPADLTAPLHTAGLPPPLAAAALAGFRRKDEPWVRAAIRQRIKDEPRLKEETIARTVALVLRRSTEAGGHPLEEVINETLYHEQRRLSRANDSRAAADRAFYANVRKELPYAGTLRLRQLVHEIVARYGDEISGHFDPRIYTVATRMLPVGLSMLLHGFSFGKALRLRGRLPNIDDRLLFEGEVDRLRELARLGTVMLVPTHSSNLDSLLMGYAIYRMKLPPFSYGAGLNLFTNPVLSFFMHNLGAYTVDRLKTDPLYRETLKEYATVSLEYREHNVFFPGGTRSRSGGIETHLKKGLLGAGIAAFSHNLRQGSAAPKIFVVPCTVSYPLVLEAATLIDDYLQAFGKARYIIADDEFTILERWRDFFRGLLALDARVHVVVGRALDPFGNEVDAEGQSLDPRGRVVDPARYMYFNGQLVDDPARDAEYNRILSRRIVETYLRDTVALPTNILAYVCLELLRRRSQQIDIYRFLRTIGPGSSVPFIEVEDAVRQMVSELKGLAEARQIRLCEEAQNGSPDILIEHALNTFSTYHTTPVIERKGMRLEVGDAGLLFYYRNRLDTFGLLGAPPLLPERGEP
jgi:glycerol-3-phosphate O-acyltransferase